MSDPATLAQTQLLPNLRAALQTAGVARQPAIALANAYPMWNDPRSGVPAPGEGKNAVEIDADCVLGAFTSAGFPRGSYEDQWLRIDLVEIWIRARVAPFAYDVEDRIHAVIGDKRAYSLGTLTILESKLYRPLQRLFSDENGFTFTTQYTFERPRN